MVNCLTKSKMSVNYGDFTKFAFSDDGVLQLSSAFHIITLLDAWAWLRMNIPLYDRKHYPEYTIIRNKIKEIHGVNYTDATYKWVIRNLVYIATEGWNAFVTKQYERINEFRQAQAVLHEELQIA